MALIVMVALLPPAAIVKTSPTVYPVPAVLTVYDTTAFPAVTISTPKPLPVPPVQAIPVRLVYHVPGAVNVVVVGTPVPLTVLSISAFNLLNSCVPK